MLKKVTSIALVLMLTLVALAPVVGLKPLAQGYDDDYTWDWDYDYDYSTTDTGAGLLGGTIGLVIACCAGIFAIANLVIWIMSLLHCIKNAPEDKKTLWIILIVLVPFANWVYFFTKKKEWDPAKA